MQYQPGIGLSIFLIVILSLVALYFVIVAVIYEVCCKLKSRRQRKTNKKETNPVQSPKEANPTQGASVPPTYPPTGEVCYFAADLSQWP